MTENEQADAQPYIALLDISALVFLAFGMAVVFVPIEPKEVMCELKIMDASMETHTLIGKGKVL